MENSKFKFLLGMLLGAILLCVVFFIIAMIGSMNLNHGCFFRYSIDSNGNLTNTDSITDSVVVNGSGNYSGVDSGNGNVVLDPAAYGKWVNSNLLARAGQTIQLTVQGEVSLCRAYIPKNNIQQTSSTNVDGDKIPIPRVEEKNIPPVSLIFDAKNQNWGNLTELYRNDEYYVALGKDRQTSLTTQHNFFSNLDVVADCSEGRRSYSPICGKYSLWNGSGASTYVSSCQYFANNPICGVCGTQRVCGLYLDIFGLEICIDPDYIDVYCSCYGNVNSTLPDPYKNDGTYTLPWTNNVADLWGITTHDCSVDQAYIDGAFQNQKYSWFSANSATGLITRIGSSVNPTNSANLGSGYSFAQIATDQSFYNNSPDYQIIAHDIYAGSNVGYLQYKLAAQDGTYADNTGGYVLNIRQTKCRRSNGQGLNDSMQGRGTLQYVIAEYGQNPNTASSISPQDITTNVQGNAAITVPNGNGGYLWFKIKNNQADYQDSIGQYNVSYTTTTTHGAFYLQILNPLFDVLKTKIQDASITMFQNMTCYHGIGGAGHCSNFFNYIKAILILYIVIYGLMFLLGMVQINQMDLITRIIKIILVSGLMNEQTFTFFNQYVFDFVSNFSDNIIANISGYALPSGDAVVSNPMMFMDEVFTKIFLSPTFAAQIMALLAMGLNGIIYFILIFICLGIVIIVGFRAIAVYLMAYLAIAVLIGIAPLFLTFILFERTRYLFENWVRFTCRYMLEPTIMLAGIIILMQLFTIYLDYVIGYSVCWKCAIPFRIPFPNIPGFNPAFLDVPLFCFNWFAPWGYDYRSTSMGANMSNMIILLMLAYCMWGYIEFSAKIVSRLTGNVGGGASATSMGSAMSSSIEQKGLQRVGLDEGSRKSIKGQAEERLRGINKSQKDAKSETGSKKDDTASRGADEKGKTGGAGDK